MSYFYHRFQQTSVESIRNLGQVIFQPFALIIGSSRPRKTCSLLKRGGGGIDRLRWLQTLTPVGHGCDYGQMSISQLVAFVICSSLLTHGNVDNAIIGETGTNSSKNMTERMFSEEALFGGDLLRRDTMWGLLFCSF